jgi:hypothetical protein
MKICPSCKNRYPTEQMFCHWDGAPLVDDSYDGEAVTVVNPDPTDDLIVGLNRKLEFSERLALFKADGGKSVYGYQIAELGDLLARKVDRANAIAKGVQLEFERETSFHFRIKLRNFLLVIQRVPGLSEQNIEFECLNAVLHELVPFGKPNTYVSKKISEIIYSLTLDMDRGVGWETEGKFYLNAEVVDHWFTTLLKAVDKQVK